MITESQVIDEESKSVVKKIIKGDGFHLEFELNSNNAFEGIWIYEYGDNEFFPLSSAHYDKEYNLLSKYVFAYDEEGEVIQFIEFNNKNDVVSKTVYDNNHKSDKYICFDVDGNLVYSFERQKCMNNGIYKDAVVLNIE